MKFAPYKVTKIDAHTWHIADQINSYMYLLEGKEKAMLIDTGSGVLPFRPVIEGLTEKPVFVVNTHGHMDHTGANYEFDEVWIAQQDAENATLEKRDYETWKKMILRYASRVFGVPEDEIEIPRDEDRGASAETILRTFSEGKVFDLGGRTVEVIATPSHTPGCVCLLERENRQLYVGDTYCNTHGILMGAVMDEAVRKEMTIELLKSVTEKVWARREEYSILFPAHHKWPELPAFLEEYIQCADEILHGARGELSAQFGQRLRHEFGRAAINYYE